MSTKPKIKNDQLRRLDNFIKQNENLDFRTVDLSELLESPAVNWTKFERQKVTIIEHLKFYRRLLNIMPTGTEHSIIMTLLGGGIYSALQISSIPKQRFVNQYSPIFRDNRNYIEAFYKNAMAIRSHILIQYMDRLQSNQPHDASTTKN